MGSEMCIRDRAIIGAASSVLSLILASIIGQLYNGTLIPMTCGFVILCGLAFMMTVYEKRQLKIVDNANL